MCPLPSILEISTISKKKGTSRIYYIVEKFLFSLQKLSRSSIILNLVLLSIKPSIFLPCFLPRKCLHFHGPVLFLPSLGSERHLSTRETKPTAKSTQTAQPSPSFLTHPLPGDRQVSGERRAGTSSPHQTPEAPSASQLVGRGLARTPAAIFPSNSALAGGASAVRSVWGAWRPEYPAGARMKERKPAASSSALARILASCASQAKDYGRCIASKVPEIEHNMCSKEFLALRACMQTVVKNKA